MRTVWIDGERVRVVKRKRDTEFAVNVMDADGDITDQNAYPTLAEARAALAVATVEAGGAVEIERWDNVWGLLENDEWTLLERDFADMPLSEYFPA